MYICMYVAKHHQVNQPTSLPCTPVSSRSPMARCPPTTPLDEVVNGDPRHSMSKLWEFHSMYVCMYVCLYV